MPNTTNESEPDDLDVGFNLNTEKLHCLIVMDDTVAAATTDRAGEAFFRAFIVEIRKTGEIWCNWRFRYTTGDSWYRGIIQPDTPLATAPVKERVQHFVKGIKHTLDMALSKLAGDKVPVDVVRPFYPPEPDDAGKTLYWLIAQDLIEAKYVDGVSVTKETDSVM